MKFLIQISKKIQRKWLKKMQKSQRQFRKYHDLVYNRVNSGRAQRRVSKIQSKNDVQVVQLLVEDSYEDILKKVNI